MYEKIIGEKFGMLKVLRRADTDFITKSGKPEPQYECLCDCGNTCLATRHYLLYNPRTQNCGCINPSKFKDMIGLKFGKLKVISRAPDRYISGKQVTMWNCHCDCGNDTVVSGHSLRNHHTESCGCGIREASLKHGDTGTKLYREWCGIKRRCYNQNHHSYKDYGARGITMCDEWKDDYLAFKTWAETQPNYEEFLNSKKLKLSIDRINNNKGYSPDNCRFATAKEQANNRRSNKLITHNGETLTVSQWADRAGLSQQAFNVRYNAGWTMDQILNTEKYSYIQRPEVDGISHTCKEWAEITGLPEDVIYERIYRHGWDPKKAITTPNRGGKLIEYNGISKSMADWDRIMGFAPSTTSRRLRSGWEIEKALSTPQESGGNIPGFIPGIIDLNDNNKSLISFGEALIRERSNSINNK